MKLEKVLLRKVSRGNKLLCIILFLSSIYLLPLTNLFLLVGDSIQVVDEKQEIPRGFAVYSPYCKIRDLDPYSLEVKPFLHTKGKYICRGIPSLEIQERTRIKLDRVHINRAEKLYNGSISCRYDGVRRAPGDSFTVVPLRKTVTFKFQEVDEEFIILTCYVNNVTPVYQTLLAFVLEKSRPRPTRARPNVLVIAIDSVSMLNMKRKLKQTYGILKHQFSAHEFKGHTKVADNTFVNVIPMFTGQLVDQMWNESMKMKYLDYLPLIWKEFERQGYLTLYQEDLPFMNTFNYLKKGFKAQPTDFYLRPFLLAASQAARHMTRVSQKHCHNTKLQVEVMLRYLTDFLHSNRDQPKFAFSMTNAFSHDDVNTVEYLDAYYFQFFQSLRASPAYNNTFIFFLSDHGIRFGKIRETYSGKLEERLPMFLLTCPPWFRSTYPNLWRDLGLNTKGLTTHFDVYWTLKDILGYPFMGSLEYPEGSKGQSLLTRTSENRSCESEHVLVHWCVCEERTALDVSDPIVKRIAEFIVDDINAQISPLNQCLNWTLSSVTSAFKTSINRNVSSFRASHNDVINREVLYGAQTAGIADYLVTLKALPGSEVFEATVRVDPHRKHLTMVGEVSRISVYSIRAHCIEKYLMESGRQFLRKFCHCIA